VGLVVRSASGTVGEVEESRGWRGSTGEEDGGYIRYITEYTRNKSKKRQSKIERQTSIQTNRNKVTPGTKGWVSATGEHTTRVWAAVAPVLFFPLPFVVALILEE
jgi:hypothetical protein